MRLVDYHAVGQRETAEISRRVDRRNFQRFESNGDRVRSRAVETDFPVEKVPVGIGNGQRFLGAADRLIRRQHQLQCPAAEDFRQIENVVDIHFDGQRRAVGDGFFQPAVPAVNGQCSFINIDAAASVEQSAVGTQRPVSDFSKNAIVFKRQHAGIDRHLISDAHRKQNLRLRPVNLNGKIATGNRSGKRIETQQKLTAAAYFHRDFGLDFAGKSDQAVPADGDRSASGNSAGIISRREKRALVELIGFRRIIHFDALGGIVVVNKIERRSRVERNLGRSVAGKRLDGLRRAVDEFERRVRAQDDAASLIEQRLAGKRERAVLADGYRSREPIVFLAVVVEVVVTIADERDVAGRAVRADVQRAVAVNSKRFRSSVHEREPRARGRFRVVFRVAAIRLRRVADNDD